ncbi:hypothetical protein Tco_1329188 [Tanacetum coccineum]
MMEPTKKFGKRRKQMARKGLHTSVDKDDSEDEDSEQDDSVTGTKTPINHVPVDMKTPSIATYKIIKQGEKGAYQIVREDGTNVVYNNFGAMLKVISRYDLTELYRIVMNRYGMNGPEDELEKFTMSNQHKNCCQEQSALGNGLLKSVLWSNTPGIDENRLNHFIFDVHIVKVDDMMIAEEFWKIVAAS